MMRRIAALLYAVLIVFSVPAYAVEPDEMLDDPVLEERARSLSAELRCLVCQNQSIDDSDAPLARDLRILVRQRLEAGDSDAEIIDFVVDRYGEFVLLKPPFAPHTWALWLAAPTLLLIAGGVLLVSLRRRRRVVSEPAPLSDAEKSKLDSILKD